MSTYVSGTSAMKIIPFELENAPDANRPHNYKVGEKQEVFPFKDLADIRAMRDYFRTSGEYRNDLMFVVGINVGLRASDLLKLKWQNVMDADGIVADGITVREKKTKKFRTFYLNNVSRSTLLSYFERKIDENIEFVSAMKKRGLLAADAIITQLQSRTLCGCFAASVMYNNALENGFTPPKGQKNKFYLFDYIFTSNKGDELEVRSAEKILKTAAKDCGIKFNVGTHSMRKTFGYHQLKAHNDDATFLCELQEMFGHSSPQITLRYCGLGGEKICQYYNDIDLGIE